MPLNNDMCNVQYSQVNSYIFNACRSEELLLLSDHHWSSGLNEAGSQTWCMKRVPWYDDPLKRITALSFDDEGTLYIGSKLVHA